MACVPSDGSGEMIQPAEDAGPDYTLYTGLYKDVVRFWHPVFDRLREAQDWVLLFFISVLSLSPLPVYLELFSVWFLACLRFSD